MKSTIFIAALLWAAAAWPAGGPGTTVNSLIEVVRAGLAEKQPDKQMAKALSKWKLTERLDSLVLEQLESDGAGPAVMEQLERLYEESAGEAAVSNPLPFASPPRPSLEEMREAIRTARDYALNYAKSLPDFLCTETVKRYEDLGPRGVWRLKDTLTLHLGYSEQHEEYKLVAINNHSTKATYESVGGAFSEGEFGSMMYVVFHPDSHPRVTWDHWTRLRGRPAQVYSYEIYMANAAYKITYGRGADADTASAGAAGQVYIDPETHAVLRVTRKATDLPADFPVTFAFSQLDYDYGEVGGKRFFLPSRASVRMDTRFVRTRNDVEFGSYRKFAGESTITFGDPTPPATSVIKK